MSELINDMVELLSKMKESKDLSFEQIEMIEKLINQAKRNKALYLNKKQVADLFEGKYVSYRNKLIEVSNGLDPTSKQKEDIQLFLRENEACIEKSDYAIQLLKAEQHRLTDKIEGMDLLESAGETIKVEAREEYQAQVDSLTIALAQIKEN